MSSSPGGLDNQGVRGMSGGSEGNGGGVGGMPRNNDNRGRDSDSQSGMPGGDGLNPHRQKGFGAAASRRIETPTLNDMRARQGAVVAKFMNFMHRKNTIVIDLYDKAFYVKRPAWESLANFVYSDLCPTAELRSEVLDVQLHPVKMMLFVKFKAVIRWWADFRHGMG